MFVCVVGALLFWYRVGQEVTGNDWIHNEIYLQNYLLCVEQILCVCVCGLGSGTVFFQWLLFGAFFFFLDVGTQ